MSATAPTRAPTWSQLLLAAVLVGLVGGAFWLKTRSKLAPSKVATVETVRQESSEALLALGIRQHNDQQYDATLELYRKILQRDLAQPQAHYNIAQIDNLRGQNVEAQREYEAALRAHPQFLDARLNLGVVLYRQRKFAPEGLLCPLSLSVFGYQWDAPREDSHPAEYVAPGDWALEGWAARQPRSKRSWGSPYKTAWAMVRGMRCAVATDALFRKLSGQVGVDETASAGKTIVIGLRQRHGRVKTVVVPDLKAVTVRRLIRQHVQRRSTIYTDGFWDHVRLTGYRHHVIDHTKRFIADSLRHTQTVESVWAHTKPDLKPRHHSIAPWYLQEYLAERDFMFNHRQHPDMIRVMLEKLLRSYALRG